MASAGGLLILLLLGLSAICFQHLFRAVVLSALLREIILASAEKYNVDPLLIAAVIGPRAVFARRRYLQRRAV